MAARSYEPHPRQKYWWLVLLQGLAVIVLSLFLFFRPLGTVYLVTLFLGAYLVVNGVLDMLFAVLGRGVDDRLWTVFKGFLAFLVGVFVIIAPYFILTTLTGWFFLIVALTLIVLGIIRLFLKRKDIGKRRLTDMVMGVLMILLGFVMLANPLFSLEVLVVLLALWGGITGIFMIIDALELMQMD